MKIMHNPLKIRKSNKISTAAKVLIPVAGVIAVKKLWDKKGTSILEDAGSKVLNKTEEFQKKVQRFHDFIQDSREESQEAVCVEESVEESAVQNVPTQEAEGGESDVHNEENVEEPEEGNKEISTELEESEKESEIN